jgi:hypothetical protein
MGLIGTLPRTNQTGVNEWGDVEANDARFRDEIDGLLDNANIKAGAGIAGSKLAAASVADDRLASPNNGAYKTLCSVYAMRDTNVGTRYFAANAGSGAAGQDLSLLNLATINAVSPGADVPRMLYLASADYAVAGLTTKLRLRAQAAIGTVAPAQTLTFGLYEITGVTAGNYVVSGSAAAGSTVAFASPSANTLNQGNSGDFTFPTDGYYVLGVAVSGAPSARTHVAAELQTRNV